MSDSIAIMREGRIVQLGTPRELYDAPANRYVADFVGESNFFAGEVVAADERGATVRTASGVTLAAPYAAGAPALERGRAVIAVRPESVRLWRSGAALDAAGLACAVKGRIQNRIYLGDQTEFSIATAELGHVLARAGKDADAMSEAFAPGSEVTLGWGRDRALVLADA